MLKSFAYFLVETIVAAIEVPVEHAADIIVYTVNFRRGRNLVFSSETFVVAF